MNQRESALASLRGRTYQAALGRDPRLLLDEGTLADALRLEAATDPATDIEASWVLGWCRWLRYLALPGSDADTELAEALGLLKRVFEANPYAVPGPLQRWYLQEEADSYARQHPHGTSFTGNRGLVENDARRLPIFHSTVAATIGSAPANRADRVQFLLDTALMLRSIAGQGADAAVLAEVAELTRAALADGPASLPQRGDARSIGAPQSFLESVTERQRALVTAQRASLESPAVTTGQPDAEPGTPAVAAAQYGGPRDDSGGGRATYARSSGRLDRDARGTRGQAPRGGPGDRRSAFYVPLSDPPDRSSSDYGSGGYGSDAYGDRGLERDGYNGASGYRYGGPSGYVADHDARGYGSSGGYDTGAYQARGYTSGGYPAGSPAGGYEPGTPNGLGSSGSYGQAPAGGSHQGDVPYLRPGPGTFGSGMPTGNRAGLGGQNRADLAAPGRMDRGYGGGPREGAAGPAGYAETAGYDSSFSGLPQAGQMVAPEVRETREVRKAPEVSGSPEWHLWAHLPERAGVGQRIALLVWVSTTGKPGSSVLLKPFSAPGGIVISVSAPGFEFGTDSDQELIVPRAGESDPVRFGLRAVAPGLHRVRADAFAGGTFLGRIELQVSVEVGAGLAEGVPRQVELADVDARPGEVTLQVNRENGAYSFQLTGESWYPRVLTRSLAADPTEVVERILAELRALASKESGFSSPRAIREHVKNLGTKLWSDIVPDAVRHQFWEQVGNIGSFVVMSNLDTVPWELLHVIDHGRPDVGFLAEQVPVMRKVYERTPVYNLAFPTSAYVVPPGSPSDALDEVGDVRAVVGDRIRDLGIVTELDTLHELFSAPPGLLHFACHNKFSPSTGSVVWMDGGPVRPDDLEQSKRRLAMTATNPLVFFNACRTAGEIAGFTEMSGWASQFMAAGAGAFVGTLWPVRSKAARVFARSFYDAMIHHATLGEASVQARKSVAQDLEDPTWLAYTIYGSPSARVLA